MIEQKYERQVQIQLRDFESDGYRVVKDRNSNSVRHIVLWHRANDNMVNIFADHKRFQIRIYKNLQLIKTICLQNKGA